MDFLKGWMELYLYLREVFLRNSLLQINILTRQFELSVRPGESDKEMNQHHLV